MRPDAVHATPRLSRSEAACGRDWLRIQLRLPGCAPTPAAAYDAFCAIDDSHVEWQRRRALDGLGDATRALGVTPGRSK